MSSAERLYGLSGKDTSRVIRESEGASHVAITDPQTEQIHHALLITGLLSPESYLRPLANRINRSGKVSHDLGHMIKGNLIFGMREQVAQKADEIAQQTGEPVDLVGYSLGGYFAADLHQHQPELVRRTVAIASPVSPVFGIQIPEGEDAVSIMSPLDTVVPLPLSWNPSFSRHRIAPRSWHQTIVFNKKVAEMVHEELARSTVLESGINTNTAKREQIKLRPRTARSADIFAA